jgi:DNA-binding NarL/FixJ family response regulator
MTGHFKVEISPDGRDYIIRIPRVQFEEYDLNGTPELVKPLTSRQSMILQLIRAGKQNKEIAELLHIAVRTVKYHISHLFNRFGVDSRVGLLRPIVRSDKVSQARGEP